MPKSLAKLKEEHAKIQAEIKKVEDKEALRIGKIALNSGILDLNISDAELKRIFTEAGARFQQKEQEQPGEAQG